MVGCIHVGPNMFIHIDVKLNKISSHIAMFHKDFTYTWQKTSHGILITLTDGCQSKWRISRPDALVRVAQAVAQINKFHDSFDIISEILHLSNISVYFGSVSTLQVNEYKV